MQWRKVILLPYPNIILWKKKKRHFNVLSHFENSLHNEKEVTNSINKIISQCKEEGDFTTENFMQWFVIEQREEENKFKEIIDNLKIIGNDGVGLYKINKELSILP